MGQAMSVTLNSIDPEGPGTFKVGVNIESQTYSFILTVTPGGIYIGNDEIMAISGDDLFNSLFRFDSKMASKIERIIGDWAAGTVVDLPLDLGELQTRNTLR